MKGHKLESAWTDDNWPFTAEQDLAIFLEMTRAAFEADLSNPLPAFEALAYVAAYAWRSDQTPDMVSIPFWAVETIVAGFKEYEASHTTPGGTKVKFGEAYKIEGGGQGKRPRFHDTIKLLRDIRLATHIVLLEEKGWKIEAALEEVATRSGLHHDTVRDLWTEYADQARQALIRFRDQATVPDSTS